LVQEQVLLLAPEQVREPAQEQEQAPEQDPAQAQVLDQEQDPAQAQEWDQEQDPAQDPELVVVDQAEADQVAVVVAPQVVIFHHMCILQLCQFLQQLLHHLQIPETSIHLVRKYH
jgi:hypothetical protein